MGIKIPEHTKKEKRPSSLGEIMNRDIDIFGAPFSNKRKEEFYSEMNVLLKSGITLTQTLELIAEGQKKQKHRSMVESMGNGIVLGRPLHVIMADHTYFTGYESSAIKIGEQTGKLTEITGELFDFFRQKNEQRKQVLSALFYPMIVLVTATVVVLFMMNFVVPIFVDIFEQQGVALPWISEMVIALSDYLSNYGWLLLLVFILLPFIYNYLKKQRWFKKPLDQLKVRVPILGNYIKKIYLTQFVQAMALLSTSKVPVLNGIGMAKDMINFYPLQSALASIQEDLLKGERMSDSFAKHTLFEKKMVALLKVAEKTNQTEYVFQRLKEQYSEDLKYRSQIITTVLNPIFLILVSLIVGVILIALYLPMFELSSVIG